ncbi:relaxase/mobilization nuclease domain-containing protein [Paracoccus sp. Ld10]|uniref:relaxase/mobilization nuclease domain-containing protein n=1 Tax=Paracoccus sp. Ld10 TaxID=649158 RepID=UPI00386875F3
MIPNLSKPGFSFKGAYDYHAHDKGTRETDDRVEWSATRNLMTDDPKTAERIMIATAQDGDRLKQEARVKNTGRKSNAHVQTLSLSWHPDERVNRAEIEQAADDVIKRLGIGDHQVAMFSHTDTKHQHIHLIINRVNPRDGRMATFSNAKRELDRWAKDYERSRGKIVSPNREAKYQRKEAMKDRYTLEERRAYMEKKAQNRAVAAEKRQKAVESTRTLPEAMKASDAATSRPPLPAEVLRELSEAQKVRHAQEWAELGKNYKAGKDKITAEWREKFRAARSDYDAQSKGKWRQFGRQQWKLEKQRDRLDQTFKGRLALSITAAREQQQRALKQGKESAGLAKLTWANLRDPELRNSTFAPAKEQDRKIFKRWYDAPLQPKIDRLNEFRSQSYREHHSRFQKDRQDLMARQNVERQQIKDAWRSIPREGRSKEIWNEQSKGPLAMFRANRNAEENRMADRGQSSTQSQHKQQDRSVASDPRQAAARGALEKMRENKDQEIKPDRKQDRDR